MKEIWKMKMNLKLSPFQRVRCSRVKDRKSSLIFQFYSLFLSRVGIIARGNRTFTRFPWFLSEMKEGTETKQRETGNFEVALRNLLPFLPRKVPTK